VVEVAEAAALTRYILVGHSLGGAISLSVAGASLSSSSSSASARLAGLVLVAAIPCRGVSDPAGAHAADAVREAQLPFSAWAAARRAEAGQPEALDADPREWALAALLQRLVPPAYSSRTWAAMVAFRADPARVAVPVLVVAGAADPLLGQNLRDFRLMPRTHASLHVLHGVGHGVPREAPEALAAVVSAFAQRIGPVPGPGQSGARAAVGPTGLMPRGRSEARL
jgi:pimeloyl-ACP methyl ester carboxylesterase